MFKIPIDNYLKEVRDEKANRRDEYDLPPSSSSEESADEESNGEEAAAPESKPDDKSK